jgi:hypothetical protein
VVGIAHRKAPEVEVRRREEVGRIEIVVKSRADPAKYSRADEENETTFRSILMT